ncbi:hypothetical protein OROGR_031336 [Orobanche gracilis]
MFSTYNYLFLFTLLSLVLVCSCNRDSLSDLRGEADQMIRSSKTLLFWVYDEIHVREIETIKSPKLHQKYRNCGAAYTKAINALIMSQDSLKSGDYKKLPHLAIIALEQTEYCDYIFMPPENETRFKNLSLKAISACKNVLEVARRLASGIPT